MLTFEQIKELIELVASHRLTGIELQRSGFRLKIDGEPPVGVGVGAVERRLATPSARQASEDLGVAVDQAGEAPAVAGEAAAGRKESGAPAAPGTAAADSAELPADAHVLTSPIVGTFYAAPNPDAKPFVRVGDRVEQGQVLCIVEAMKLMNEIESDVDGVVFEIYPQNAQPVEYGEPLFAIRPG